jgi:hydrogenase-4 component F
MHPMLLVAPMVFPLAAAALCGAMGWRTTFGPAGMAGIAAALGVLADATVLAVTVASDGPVTTAGGLLRADALSAWMLLVVGVIAVLAWWASPDYLAAGHPSRHGARWYGVLLNLFVAAMTAAVLAGNLGILWVAVEMTTIVTAFLVGHRRTRTALEAAWKYVVICSAAIAIAFLGIVLMYYGARHAGLGSEDALTWTALVEHADRLDPAVTRIAVGLAVLGFGAKAGLVPLHAWLPDAHSQAPAPVSALMSGVLLSVAFYAVLRFKVIADAVLGQAFMRTLLLILAIATLALAALLLLGQRDYKRMLAYSSMEHIGLMAVGTAAGSRLAIAAVLLHVAGHGLAKTVAFLGSGHLLHHHGGSSDISAVRGLATRMPVLGGLFGMAMLALLGFPPASIFASELGIARAGASTGLGWAVAVAFVLVLLAFIALIIRTGAMLLGRPTGQHQTGEMPSVHRLGFAAAAPLVVGLVLLAGLGVSTWPVDHLLTTAAAIVGVP